MTRHIRFLIGSAAGETATAACTAPLPETLTIFFIAAVLHHLTGAVEERIAQ